MKILFINLPYHGHMIPTIGLVQGNLRKIQEGIVQAPGNSRAVKLIEESFKKNT